jgi:predicted deacylase
MVFDTDPDRLSRLGERLFDMIVPIGWNDSVAQPFAGSAIFLHAAGDGFPPTAGCVAVGHDRILDLAQRLRPGMMIDIAPANTGADRTIAPTLAAPGPIEAVSFHGLGPGPRVIVTGAVHGDEPAGPAAIGRLIAEVRAGAVALLRGTVTFVPVVNGLAWQRSSREGQRNLNRNLSEKVPPQDSEGRVGNILCRLLRDHDILIDLHSFSAEGEPMVLTGSGGAPDPASLPALSTLERDLAVAMGLPVVVHGWLAAHDRARSLRAAAGLAAVPPASAAIGTTEYMRASGGCGVTVECDQHAAADGPQTGYRAVLRAPAHLGMTPHGPAIPASGPARRLEIIEPILSHHDDGRLLRQFRAGEPVVKGQTIGQRHDGSAITAPQDGALIFASETAMAGTKLCFFCRLVDGGSCKGPACRAAGAAIGTMRRSGPARDCVHCQASGESVSISPSPRRRRASAASCS